MSVIRISQFDVSSVDKDTVFVLDTNILYFVHSGYYLPNSNKCRVYSNMIQDLLNSNCHIYVSSLSLQELFFGIENKEYKNYCIRNNKNPLVFHKKDFRNIAEERLNIKVKLMQVMSEISVYTQCDGKVNCSFLENFLLTYNLHKMDPVDYLLVKNYDTEKTIFVTDDRDYFSMQNINVLTI